MADPVQDGTLHTRRSLLAAAAGGAVALAAGAIKPAPAAAASAAMMTEVDNVTALPTSVSNATAGQQALIANATGDGRALEANSDTGPAVLGVSADTTDPATNANNAGVVGVAGDSTAISSNIALTGVYGYADQSPADGFVGVGVWGESPDFGVVGSGGIGVFGSGPFGVIGSASTTDGIGVEAAVDVAGARALRVAGRAEFTRSGRTGITAGHSTKKVTLAGCTTSTLLFAVIASNRSGRYVRAIVPAAGYFTIYLNATVSSLTNVAWIAFTNPSNHAG